MMKKGRVKAKTMGEDNRKNLLTTLIRKNESILPILEIVSRYKHEKLWIAGGLVRNMVWEYVNDSKTSEVLPDIDIFYYNRDYDLTARKKQERIIEEELRGFMPDRTWSVKNQARMHLHRNNRENQYVSMEDALRKTTDTASAMAVRLEDGKIIVISPFGLSDLFNKVIRPTPNFSKPERLKILFARIYTKRWVKKYRVKIATEIREAYKMYAQLEDNNHALQSQSIDNEVCLWV